ncbi:hypothetical protein H5M87_003049 [Salmonella enterica]|uniref:Uncharacterized protein n=1 Tax=Salmonella enterica subsp. enterica serovar Rough O:d:1,7 TaxID=1974323 RepID=A0A974KIF7_SALET|nr:hypothetical protein [Salmonella enterica]EGA3603041.1 hypothetical protein [Salmonella enterica]OSD72724.1 hypothetical protein R537_07145 [Salmonella enterica subsp. enterica serovar Rough O:d:1,7]
MNALTVAQSYLLLIGSIVLAVFIVQLPLLIKDCRYKRRQKEKPKIIFLSADKYKTRDGDIIPIWDKTLKP